MADDLLAAAARRLGERWEDDTLAFVDVSIGVSTLFRVNAYLRKHSHAAASNADWRAVFATLPGQTHTLGIILAAEAFRRSDWDVALQLEADADSVVNAVAKTHASLVGFTAGWPAPIGLSGDVRGQRVFISLSVVRVFRRERALS